MSNTYKDLKFTSFPDEEQKFIEMFDISADDASKLKAYQDAIAKGDLATAENIIKPENWSTAKNKILDAEKMNTLFDTCIALQKFYKNDVKDWILRQQGVWEDEVNKADKNVGYVGEYRSGTTYAINNIVLYLNNLYLSLINGNTQTPTNVGAWRPLTIPGLDGQAGTGITFSGEWSSVQTYSQGNIVSRNGGIWQAIQSNVGQDPVTSPAFWRNVGDLHAVTIEVSKVDTGSDYWFEVVR